MSKPTSIRECMRRNPITISKDAPLVQAVERLVEFKLTGLTVVDEDGIPCGKLTELDCIKAVLNAIYNDGNPDATPVAMAMEDDFDTCRPEESIVEVAQRMIDTRQRRNAVVDDQGRLVGQVSSSNILWALLEHSRANV
jgi:CBS domain-containing protein